MYDTSSLTTSHTIPIPVAESSPRPRIGPLCPFSRARRAGGCVRGLAFSNLRCGGSQASKRERGGLALGRALRVRGIGERDDGAGFLVAGFGEVFDAAFPPEEVAQAIRMGTAEFRAFNENPFIDKSLDCFGDVGFLHS